MKRGKPIPMPRPGTPEYALLPAKVTRDYEAVEDRTNRLMWTGVGSGLLAMVSLALVLISPFLLVIPALIVLVGAFLTMQLVQSGPNPATVRQAMAAALREPDDPDWQAVKKLMLQLAEAGEGAVDVQQTHAALAEAFYALEDAKGEAKDELRGEIQQVVSMLEGAKGASLKQSLADVQLRLDAAVEVEGIADPKKAIAARAAQKKTL